MKRQALLVATAAIAIVAALALSACGGSSEGGGSETSSAAASFTPQTHRICAGASACAVLLDDGTVSCSLDTSEDQYIVVNDEWKSWSDIVDISMNEEILVGAKADGSVVWCGGRQKEYEVLADPQTMDVIDTWKDVVQVSAGYLDVAALKADGTVEVTGSIWTEDLSENAGFTQVSIYDALLCLRTDGTVYCYAPRTYEGQNWEYDVSSWADITQVSAGWDHAVALKKDGTCVATGNNDCGQCDVGKWTDIVQVFAGREQTLGLKKDGTVVKCGTPLGDGATFAIEKWSDMTEISGFFDAAMGLKSDGSIVYTDVYNRLNAAASSIHAK